MNGNWIKYLASAACCVSLMMMSLTESSIYLNIVLGICIVFILRPEVVFSAYFIASLSGGFFSVGTLGASRLLSILVIISLIMKWQKLAKVPHAVVLWELLIIIYSFFSCVFSITGEMSSFLIMIQCLLVTFLLRRYVIIDSALLLNMIIINSIIALVFLGLHMIQDVTIMFDDRYSGAEGLSTNKFAMMCAQLGAVMIGSFRYLNNKLFKIVPLGMFAVSVLIIVFSGSRSALIGLLAATLFVVIIIQGVGFKKTILPILLISLLGFVLVHYLTSLDSPIVERFSVEAVNESGGSGRLGYAQQIMDRVIINHPLFGVGMGGQNVMALGIEKQSHNIIIDPISQLGLVGFFFYLCYIVPIIIQAFRIRKNNSFIIIPLALFITALFNGIGEVVFYEKFFWNSIAFCAVVAAQSRPFLKYPKSIKTENKYGTI